MSSTEVNHDEESLTMMDILEEQEALQEDAEAVLGAGDDEHCTYDKGYLPRQALYACLTCSPVGGAGGRAGVCLACSLHCHNTHNLVELYTKREFRCDCGNSKFIMNPCKLTPSKETSNEHNLYSQNHDGLYCTCHRPYPDPEQTEEEEDEMIQCCACEDWYHSKHLGVATVPAGDQYSEMICAACVARLPFLANYAALAVTPITNSDTNDAIDVETSASLVKEGDKKTNLQKVPDQNAENANSATKPLAIETQDDAGQKLPAQPDTEVAGCSAGQFKAQVIEQAALFFPDDWRSKLCTCSTCKSLYEQLSVKFLCDSDDTICHYEQQARERRAASGTTRQRSVEQELDALNSVDRVTRTEMVTEYNNLSSNLREYLRKFATSGKVVRGEDITEFFSGLQAKKKQRTMDGIPPDSCKW